MVVLNTMSSTMSTTPTYTSGIIASMNCGDTWRHTIKMSEADKQKNTGDLWELHATGNATLNGREYCALPKGTKLTSEVKIKYNIW